MSQIVKLRVDTSAMRRYLARSRAELAEARHKFTIINTVTDPDTGVKYYKLVDEGRGAVRPKNAKKLRFKLDAGTTVFALSVGPSRPRRITKNALARLRHEIPDILREALLPRLSRNRLPFKADIEHALEGIKLAALKVFRKVAIQRTATFNTRFEFYDREDGQQLANSFEIRE